MVETLKHDQKDDEWRKQFKMPSDAKRELEKLKGKFHFEKVDFQWLLQNLLTDNDRVLGCEVTIPDTCIIETGLPKIFVKTDKNGCICQTANKRTTINHM